ncbi:hypothetical protein [Geobacillus phage TP-84]|uniref:Uncharacterized protein n=1 Tax=Geobacillus phage TP-84 TaxID=1965361 RepID=A0A1U9WQM0_9CAUD|nr:hypothetical protein MUK65_gp33 [Geobacillus phage TP-84]AQY55050.1 hypothetical protein [Geobacillus phage TP-84]
MFKTEKQINEAKAALKKGVIVYYFNEAAMNAHIGIVVDTDPEYYSGEGVSVMLVDRNLKPKQDVFGRIIFDIVFYHNEIYRIWETVGEFFAGEEGK